MTGDKVQGTMGRVKRRGEACFACFLLPAFLFAQIFIKGETSGYEAGDISQRPFNAEALI